MALPSSGSLSIKGAAGAGRSISQEVDGNETGNKSLVTLSTAAGKTAPHSMLEFYGYANIPPAPTSVFATNSFPEIEVTWNSGGGSVTNWRVEREVNSSGFILMENSPDTIAIDDAATSGQNHQYRVRAENGSGVSDWVYSNIVMP